MRFEQVSDVSQTPVVSLQPQQGPKDRTITLTFVELVTWLPPAVRTTDGSNKPSIHTKYRKILLISLIIFYSIGTAHKCWINISL